jgi:antitoxin component of RelBE/YafQ-DinJ toxin-antitoxin module
MDAKITLSFDASIIEKARSFAEKNNISLSRLTEFLLSKAIEKKYISLDEMPVSDWINILQEGKVEYKTRKKSNKQLREEYRSKSKK